MMAYKLDMSVKPILAAVNDIFDLSYGKIKLLCELLVCDPVEQSAFQDHPVSLSVSANYPVINKTFKVCSRIILHFTSSCASS